MTEKRLHHSLAGLAGLLLGLGLASTTLADPGDAAALRGLAGKIFAVRAEVTASVDPGFPQGLIFDNCYHFNEDGIWWDPLFPGQVEGTWVQHSALPRIEYTVAVSDQENTLAPGVVLTQNGTVVPGLGAGPMTFTAYTTAWVIDVPTPFPAVEVISRGNEVETCPFDLD